MVDLPWGPRDADHFHRATGLAYQGLANFAEHHTSVRDQVGRHIEHGNRLLADDRDRSVRHGPLGVQVAIAVAIRRVGQRDVDVTGLNFSPIGHARTKRDFVGARAGRTWQEIGQTKEPRLGTHLIGGLALLIRAHVRPPCLCGDD